MMNERLATAENLVTKDLVAIREGEWSLRDRRGSVAALIPIQGVPVFREIAVLACPRSDTHQFAARIVHTDDWVHFHALQPWMQPFMNDYLKALDRYTQIAELVARTHRLTQ